MDKTQNQNYFNKEKETNLKKLIEKYLVCPECHGSLNLDNYGCTKCDFRFSEADGILNLLPKDLTSNKLNEDRKWEKNNFREKKENPAWFSLVVKGEDVFYFWEKIFPSYVFKGDILEIGAGTCWISSLIKYKNPDVEIIATDVAMNALKKGKEIEKIVGGKIDSFIACDGEKLPFRNECFDIIVGASIVHHFSNPEKGTSEIFRVLKKGGFYLSILELEANFILGPIWGKMGTAGNTAKQWGIKENVYNFKQYADFFKKAGFKKVEFFLERDPEYKHHHWFLALYYKLMSFFPDWIVKLIGSSIGFSAYK